MGGMCSCGGLVLKSIIYFLKNMKIKFEFNLNLVTVTSEKPQKKSQV